MKMGSNLLDQRGNLVICYLHKIEKVTSWDGEGNLAKTSFAGYSLGFGISFKLKGEVCIAKAYPRSSIIITLVSRDKLSIYSECIINQQQSALPDEV